MSLDNKKRYFIYGAVFGFLFPLFSLVVIFFFPNRIWVLFIVISTAPLFLGFFALLAGIRQDQLNEVNLGLEKLVRERTSKIKNMLDVTGQGFFSFGADFIVEEHYSRKCEAIFNKKPAGLNAADLLFTDQQMREDFVEGFTLFFKGQAKFSVILKMMEKEIAINDIITGVEYRVLNEKAILCILSDMTLQLLLKDREKREIKERNIVFQVLSHQNYFSSFLKEAEELFHIFESIGEWKKGSYEDLQRAVHTFKGNASFFAFEDTESAANNFEDYIAASLALDEKINHQNQAKLLKEAYENELSSVLRTFGEKWLDEIDQVSIPYDRYMQLEEIILQEHGKDSELFREFQQFRKTSIKAMLAPLPQMCQRTANSLGKKIEPLEIRGDEIHVLPEHYKNLVSTFTHLIRNMLDHGIETPLERKKKNKPEGGSVFISIELSEGGMIICFADDGRGISYQEIEVKGRREGILSSSESYSPDELLELILFKDFSTSKHVTEISGRGLGLWAVKTEIDKLKGRINVETAQDRGTSVIMWVPLVS